MSFDVRFAAATSPESGAAPGREPARILVVDDDPDVRELTVECLRELGYDVDDADHGNTALARLEHDARCDLLLVDLGMPGMNGAEIVRRARALRPNLRVLFATGYADSSRPVQVDRRDRIIRKPFKLAALAEAVRDALAAAPPSSTA